MRRHLSTLTVLAAAALLAGCATTPASVDLDEARAWLATVEAAQSDGPGAAGSASLLAGGPSTADPDGAGQDDGIRLDFDNPTPLKHADAACFGGGQVDLTVTVEYTGGTSTETFGTEVPCDEEVHEIELSPDAADAATVSAIGTPETYVHVVLIQEMTVQE